MASKSSSRKRFTQEVDDYSNLGEMETVNIHGVLKTLSPVKKGKHSNFFDGVLTDRTSKMRVVGFRSEHRRKLGTFSDSKDPVTLEDCQVKLSRQGHRMQALLKNTTKISPSAKTFNIPDEDQSGSVILAKVEDKPAFEKVTVVVKVQSKADAVEVTGGKRKQDLVVADSTSSMTVVLWEDHIDSMSSDVSYRLEDFMVREYNMKKFLSIPRNGGKVVEVPDIGVVESDCTLLDLELVSCLFEAQIVGVPGLELYNACLKCKARVEPLTPPLGRCSKDDCAMMQRFDMCTRHILAKLLLLHGTEKKEYMLQKSSCLWNHCGRMAQISSGPQGFIQDFWLGGEIY